MYDAEDITAEATPKAPVEAAAAQPAPAADQPAAAQPAVASARRGPLFAILGGTVAIAALAVGGWFLIEGGRHVKTDNAYVDASTASITPLVSASVKQADIYETKDSIVVLAEMPGVAADGVDISLERRVLTIRGRSAANDHSRYQRVYNEYADGDYERVFTLSENIDRDRIEATLRDGVLQLVLPNAEAAKPRKIELKTS